MSRHADPPRVSDASPVPEPTFAERARTLVDQGRTGTLATLSRKHPGHPFGSIMPYALDAEGRPLLLISSMAVHTQNLGADPRASLFVTQPGSAGEPLAAGRVTLMGEARPLSAEQRVAARTTYLARHESAAYWAEFEDFAFWRLEVADVYFVGGFAAMGWVEAEEYRRARPDPLADVAPGILEHMNRDHADALVAYAQFFAGAQAEEATMDAVDRLGFKLRLRQGQRRWSVRIPFPREVTSAGESRAVLIEMLRRARGGTSPPLRPA
ncbi:MAG: pyridoxamine 5'-phosphate oxidase [Candidatus Rokubacteria bacterium 13_1_40CM_69_27]|nr:MAG: pyridoxamine 5'-phosphate oxidase [Candidatus Rokubacteria bacterium 13_1_40CM_69_27]